MQKLSSALWVDNGSAYSPDSFLSILWRLVPRFRWVHT